MQEKTTVSFWKSPRGYALAWALFTFVFLLLTSHYNQLLRYEHYWYLLKAFEITNGNFEAMPSHSIGWPAILAVFFKLFGIGNVFAGMVVARIVGSLFLALCVLPFAKLAFRVLEEPAAKLAVIGFALFGPLLQLGSSEAGTEAPFFFAQLLFLVLLTAPANPSTGAERSESSAPLGLRAFARPIWAAGIAALAWYVRPNGLILGAFLLIALLWRRSGWKPLALCAATFLVVSGPLIYSRQKAFGSFMEYGVNSKFLADNHGMAQAYNVPVPGIVEYLKTHSPKDWVRKFGKEGEYRALKYVRRDLLGDIWLIPVFLGLVLYVFFERKPYFGMMLGLAGLWLASFALTFSIFESARYVLVLASMVVIFGTDLIHQFAKRYEKAHILRLAFVVLLLPQPVLELVRAAKDRERFAMPYVKDEWAHWATEQGGMIALDHDFELIHMCYSPSVLDLAHGVSQVNARDPDHQLKLVEKQGIGLFKPGLYGSVEELLADLKKWRVKYLLLDDDYVATHPFWQQIKDGKNFWKVKEFGAGDDWAVPGMVAYAVVYGK